MNCQRVMSFALVCLMGMSAAVIAQESEAGHKLTVDVANIKDSGGQLIISLFTKKDGFPDNSKKAEKSVTVKVDKPTHTFTGLKPGKYVVVVFHDLNSDNKIDKNRIGIPAEPIGLSNHPKIGIGGPPDFNKAKVDVSKDVSVKIELNKVGR